MDKTANVEELIKHLDQVKDVAVVGAGDTRWSFRIRPLPLFYWDPENTWYFSLRQESQEKWLERLSKAISAASESVLRKVLVKGVAEPTISENGQENSIPLDRLLQDEILCTNLYTAIAQFSCDVVLKSGAQENAGTKVPGNSR